MIRYVRNKVPEADAQDLVQECLAVLVDKRDTIENYKAFLYIVVGNKIKQYYDRRARKAGFLGIIWSEQLLSMESLSTSLSIRVARRNDLEAAMQALPLRQYQAFELRYVEGLEISDAATALAVSSATLKRDIERARRSLAARLGRDSGFGEETPDGDLARIVQAYIRTD